MSDLPPGFALDKPTAAAGDGLPPGFVPDKNAPAAPTAPPAAAPFEPIEMPINYAGGEYARTVVPPVVNFLTTPLRAPGATLSGVVQGALPVDEPSRKKFYDAKQAAMERTAIPETEGGKGISSVLGAPGEGISNLARALGNATIGPETTEAVAPYVSSAAEIALPGAGAVVGRRRGAAPHPERQPVPQAVDARAAGYTLPPEEISASPSFMSRIMSGESGKWKKQQAVSVDNQRNTNRLAAQSIGLPPGTRLTELALERARQPAARAYDAVRALVPETALAADPVFQQAASQVGVRSAEVEHYFPHIADNPSIVELRQRLLRNGTAPTRTVMAEIADLRKEASANFRKRDEAHAHSLGYAQRQAAAAMEDAIERSIGYGTPRMQAMTARSAAEAEVARQTAQNTARGYGPGQLPQAQAALQAADQALQALPPVTAAEQAAAHALRQQYQGARQLFARTYDVESSLNRGTRDVVASRMANLRRVRGRPLEGEMRQIADAAEAFPREMQDPARFGGHAEDFSVLDLIGGGAAMAAGHPVAAGIIAGRYPARRLIGSEWMQNRMFNRQPPTQSGGYIAGTAAAPSGVQEDDPLARALGQ